MGFFSWKTADTKRSIANRYSEEETFPVVLIAPDGRKWIEESYEGYGVFGGKDIYELIAELNGKKTRDEGIDLCFNNVRSGDFEALVKKGFIL